MEHDPEIQKIERALQNERLSSDERLRMKESVSQFVRANPIRRSSRSSFWSFIASPHTVGLAMIFILVSVAYVAQEKGIYSGVVTPIIHLSPDSREFIPNTTSSPTMIPPSDEPKASVEHGPEDTSTPRASAPPGTPSAPTAAESSAPVQSIAPSASLIRITEPNGGFWYRGNRHSITWDSYNGQKSLTLVATRYDSNSSGGSPYFVESTLIASEIVGASSGQYPWEIPGDISAGVYRISVYSGGVLIGSSPYFQIQ